MSSEITTPKDAVHIQVDIQWEAFFVIKVGFVWFSTVGASDISGITIHARILIQKLGSNWVFGFILMADHHMLSTYLFEMPHSCWCDARFVHGHTCAKKQFLLLVVEGDDFGSEWVNFELQHIEVTACVFFGTPGYEGSSS
ncbi:PREDICTED: LOC109948400 isoform X4 [Prunus dulcis]|uniref:PREDICTED: LOC109948400 isoform X4 n=1 Tax=Prunus dulcis TaxID=3755 RepID=A0A5E4F8S0_PRUDU|nr:PREDICTED: LOC109948400 isoform X4 [Prunus dulcis]